MTWWSAASRNSARTSCCSRPSGATGATSSRTTPSVREEVYDYLNEHFVNVFIDADIHNAGYRVKYRAKGLPFTSCFSSRTAPIHFRYSGHALRRPVHRGAPQEIRKQHRARRSPSPVRTSTVEPYESARDTLDDTEDLDRPRRGSFRDGILENFDPARARRGARREGHPAPHLPLPAGARGEDQEREAAVAGVARLSDRAIEAIYDPVEGRVLPLRRDPGLAGARTTRRWRT